VLARPVDWPSKTRSARAQHLTGRLLLGCRRRLPWQVDVACGHCQDLVLLPEGKVERKGNPGSDAGAAGESLSRAAHKPDSFLRLGHLLAHYDVPGGYAAVATHVVGEGSHGNDGCQGQDPSQSSSPTAPRTAGNSIHCHCKCPRLPISLGIPRLLLLFLSFSSGFCFDQTRSELFFFRAFPISAGSAEIWRKFESMKVTQVEG
jgi:hypothetical protein